jgi:excisionase family DNA binding protein
MILINEKPLKALISQAVDEAIKPHIERLAATPNMKPVYTIDEVTEMFGVSKRHLQYLRDSGQIGYIQNGRKILFRAEDLNKFFENHYIGRASNG